jgi:uncharacterized repeat protein (TIGR04076 family)
MENIKIGLDRRNFLKTTSIGGASLAASCGLVSNILAADVIKDSSLNSPKTLNDEMLNSFKSMLNYTDDQWEIWKSNPRNFERVKGGLNFGKYKLTAEVVSAYGCGAGHKVGDKIIFSGGELLSKENPERICFGLLSAISPYVQLVMERVFNGEDPTKIAFNTTHCPDVGVNHGGWGEVIVDIKVEKVQT